MKVLSSLLLSLSAVIFVSCATTNPVSSHNGQTTVNTTPQNQSASLVRQGEQAFAQYKKTRPMIANAQVTRVGNRLKRVVPNSSAKWEFVTFRDNTPNAFALPGGKVGVHSGILPITKTDAGLATVLAHEIAHVTLDHHKSKQQQQAITGLGAVLIDAALGGGYSQALQSVGQVAFNLPLSRENEIAADQVGLVYMAQAGYDPREAITFWERFSQYKHSHGRGATSDFLSTHPHDTKRIAALKQILPYAMEQYKKR